MIEKELDIALRAYTQKPGKPHLSKYGKARHRKNFKWKLIFDCETTADAIHALRFGVYQIRRDGECVEAGIFYEPCNLTDEEHQLLKEYAQSAGLQFIDRAFFNDRVFLRYAYDRRAMVIGFNLPFDISRVAIGHSSARRDMRGGFTFDLSRDKTAPKLRIKHLSTTSARINFPKPDGQDRSRGMRKRGIPVDPHRGHFCDVRTFAKTLRSRAYNLRDLAADLGTATQKHDRGDLGRPVDRKLIEYAVADVQTTWECYEILAADYARHGLAAPPNKLFSEASLGKAYLAEMGIKPLLECRPDMPEEIFGLLMGAYFGGRAEVRDRRRVREVAYCDFKSMYPTSNALMGLWRFMIADCFEWSHATDQAKKILENAKPGSFQSEEAWKQFPMLVRVRPDKDLFPTRAKYNGKSYTIGLNYLSYPGDLWVTLADCLSAKFLSGKTPKVLDAIAFKPGPIQGGLKAIELFGNPNYRVDPENDDAFVRLIDLRDHAKSIGDPGELAIKIIANATSYGVTIEVNRDDAPKAEPLELYRPDCEKELVKTQCLEEPGKLYNPALGVFITAAARLMLALAEHQAKAQGLDWVFCDTDSLAMSRPEEIDADEFEERVRNVVNWFVPLNPYRKPGSILQLEKQNFSPSNPELRQPLYALAISAKRYVLFNVDEAGQPIIRKASAHGLGPFKAPYSEHDAPLSIPSPSVPLKEIGVDRWQYDLWYKTVDAALAGHPERVDLDYHPALSLPAIGHYSGTSPRLVDWMKHWNSADGKSKAYGEQFRPFGFLTQLFAKRRIDLEFPCGIHSARGRGRPPKYYRAAPVSSFTNDPSAAAKLAFDRISGKPVEAAELQTYRDILRNYHLSPESKFANGGGADVGFTERFHVKARRIVIVGKEANKVGQFGEPDPTSEAVAKFLPT
ncbi:hypothetical protein [Henriciella sp.]|uniref:hypothetical protein n=2 Tax=Henriciella TaxID=453849 RepID=UPI0025BDFA7C|nr:hypothetical protein [Henriciella sp.]|tara:strand:- start:4286 stop:7009 length:2724 start_codon:yes stop_codon:yes gene_type:complete